MNKITLFSILFCFVLIIGCGGDDEVPGPGPGPTTKTVTANSTVGSPDFINPNHAAWNSVTSTTVDIAGATPKLGTPKSAAVSDDVMVQAIVNNDSLFIRVRWSDDDYSVWKNYFTIMTVGPPIAFSQANQVEDEDQLFVMFDGGDVFGWDIWNWRSLTTAPGFLAEGMRFVDNALVIDAGASKVAYINKLLFFNQPYYLHKDTSDFTGYILYTSDTLNPADTNLYGNPVRETLGWQVDQRIPGWYIDSTLAGESSLKESQRGSRFDIRSISAYNEATNQYTVVMGAKLHSGFTDDLDYTTLETITIKVGIINNLLGYTNIDFTSGNSDKGFTANINLVLK